MARRDRSDDARRRRHAAAMARCRSRQRRGVELYEIEAGGRELDLCVRFGGLQENQVYDKTMVASALGRLLRRALVALLNEEARRR
jgi:hypothetical protein